MAEFGLIGKNIDYSFSRGYFSKKFLNEKLPYSYVNFDIPHIEEFPEILKTNPQLKGLNVTIPYKESIIPYLDHLDPRAKEIGAVNTILLHWGKTYGFNTDWIGFSKALEPSLPLKKNSALILGTGGASKAIAFALEKFGIDFMYVSRNQLSNGLTYKDLTKEIILNHSLIINCTPVGTFPEVTASPPLPYEYIGEQHVLFDLIYNPSETAFLREGKIRGARTENGLKMLEFQAEAGWSIWNK